MDDEEIIRYTLQQMQKSQMTTDSPVVSANHLLCRNYLSFCTGRDHCRRPFITASPQQQPMHDLYATCRIHPRMVIPIQIVKRLAAFEIPLTPENFPIVFLYKSYSR
jgi:hypothetical protein